MKLFCEREESDQGFPLFAEDINSTTICQNDGKLEAVGTIHKNKNGVLSGRFKCKCKPGWGDTCCTTNLKCPKAKINKLDPITCDPICENNGWLERGKCICVAPFEGRNCDIGKCYNGGFISGSRCKCDHAYIDGTRCEYVKCGSDRVSMYQSDLSYVKCDCGFPLSGKFCESYSPWVSVLGFGGVIVLLVLVVCLCRRQCKKKEYREAYQMAPSHDGSINDHHPDPSAPPPQLFVETRPIRRAPEDEIPPLSQRLVVNEPVPEPCTPPPSYEETLRLNPPTLSRPADDNATTNQNGGCG